MGRPEAQVYSLDAESARNDSEQQLVRPRRSWKGYVWDTFDLPEDERWLLFKLDAFVLTFASVSAQFASMFAEVLRLDDWA